MERKNRDLYDWRNVLILLLGMGKMWLGFLDEVEEWKYGGTKRGLQKYFSCRDSELRTCTI